MTTFLASLSETDTVQQAAQHFLRSRLSSAPVVNATGELSGIVSEKDMLGLMRAPRNWLRPLHEIMKRNVICYEIDTPIENIYEFLCRVAIRQVIIVDKRKPLGMINQMNLVRWFSNWFETTATGECQELTLADDRLRTHSSIVTAAEQLSAESRQFLQAVKADQPDLVPLLIASATRIQEKLNDLLALSRHANECDHPGALASSVSAGSLRVSVSPRDSLPLVK